MEKAKEMLEKLLNAHERTLIYGNIAVQYIEVGCQNDEFSRKQKEANESFEKELK
jgi:hypothetical protein